jgi:hypothetical protein
MKYDDIVLETEQKKLLSALVEASRSVPRDKRRKFLFIETSGGSFIKHFGLPGSHSIDAYKGDVEILGTNGLLLLSTNTSGSYIFDVAPEGFKYYEEMKLREGQPLERVQSEVRGYLSIHRFQENYANAYEKWRNAEAALWSTESEDQLSVIGHLCREAMQEFSTVLVNRYNPPNVDTDKAHHIARLKTVFAHHSNKLSSKVLAFLDSLVGYWGALSDLVQRQEHAAQKEGESIVWEDARRIVFQTAIVMYEIDRALSHNEW